MNVSSINWYEIPVTDMTRARAFYEAVFNVELKRELVDPMDMAIFPGGRYAGGVTGCLVSGPGHVPGAGGSLVYLDAAPDLDALLERVPANGGRVVFPKTRLPNGLGFFAHIADTEGNRVGVHVR